MRVGQCIGTSRIGRDGFLYYDARMKAEDVQARSMQPSRPGGVASHTSWPAQPAAIRRERIWTVAGHTTIILDIFPRDMGTGYYATYAHGSARPRQRRRKENVCGCRAAQAVAFRTLRAGVNGQEVHLAFKSFSS